MPPTIMKNEQNLKGYLTSLVSSPTHYGTHFAKHICISDRNNFNKLSPNITMNHCDCRTVKELLTKLIEIAVKT